jgi:hypothetical protein
MPSIIVDDEVFAALQERGKAFVDTPNSVLRRVLELERSDGGPRKYTIRIGPSTRAARGEAITQADYEIPLLEVLDKMGGSARREDALRALEQHMSDRLGDVDRAALTSGAIRWEKTASWAVKSMKTNGLLESTDVSGWGTWKITEAGRALLRKSRSKHS